MTTKNRAKTSWAVVKVIRGYTSEVQLFDSAADASKRVNYWRPRINPDYDEVAAVKTRTGRLKPRAKRLS